MCDCLKLSTLLIMSHMHKFTCTNCPTGVGSQDSGRLSREGKEIEGGLLTQHFPLPGIFDDRRGSSRSYRLLEG